MRKSSGSRRHLSRTLSEAPQTPLIHSNVLSHIPLLRVPQRSSQRLLRRLPKRHSEASLHLANLLCRNGCGGMPAAKMDGFLCMIPETPGRLLGACQEVYGEIVGFTQAPLQNALRGSSDIAHPFRCLTHLTAQHASEAFSDASQSGPQRPLRVPSISPSSVVPQRFRTFGQPDGSGNARQVACGAPRGARGNVCGCLWLRPVVWENVHRDNCFRGVRENG